MGTIAIQIAKHLGCYVATTAREKNKKFLEELGADEVIDFENDSFENILDHYDAVLDLVGGETYIKSFKVIKNGGIIVSLLETPREDCSEKYAAMLAHLREETGENPKITATFMLTGVTQDRLTQLSLLVDKGVLEVILDKTFSLEKTNEALEYQEKHHPRGKVVVQVFD